MQKLSKNYKIRQQRIALDRARRAKLHPVSPDYIPALIAPKYFAIERNPKVFRDPMLRFIRKMWATGIAHKKFIIDFTNTEKLFTAATLLFTAELEHMLEVLRPQPIVICKKPTNRTVSHAFKQLGIYDSFRTGASVIPEGEDIVHWKKTTGAAAIGQRVEDVAAALKEELFGEIYLGATEAMTNVCHHAYGAGPQAKYRVKLPTGYRRWWMFSQQKEGKLTVAFCDLGVGIPASLPKNPKKTNLWHRIRRPGILDSEIILEATHDSVSRMKEEHRGHGLGQIVAAVDEIPNASVTIWSNKGMYNRRHGQQPVTKDYSESIMGTLITWNVPITSGDTA